MSDTTAEHKHFTDSRAADEAETPAGHLDDELETQTADLDDEHEAPAPDLPEDWPTEPEATAADLPEDEPAEPADEPGAPAADRHADEPAAPAADLRADEPEATTADLPADASDLSDVSGEQAASDTAPTAPSTESLLTQASAEAFLDRWSSVQVAFVEDPHRSVSEADTLLTQVLAAYQQAVEQRRAKIAAGAGDDTEDLRLALLEYRALITAMLPSPGIT